MIFYYTKTNIIYFYEITPEQKNKTKNNKKNNRHSGQNIKVEIAKNNAKFGS